MSAITKHISEGVAWLELNLAEEPVNKITAAIRDELRGLLESVCTDNHVQAAILVSRKADQFMAGADVDEFARLENRKQALELVRDGQTLINRIETIGKPIVAAIHGACIGGGLEAALACTYRIASDHPKTILRLPEVRLGIIPAAGGCQRLPRLIGLRNALDMILTGRPLTAQQARKRQLVDEVVHASILDAAALKAAKRLAEGWRPKRRRHLVDHLARKVVFARARRTVLAKTSNNYPAPLAALDAVAHGLQYGLDEGLDHEAAHFSELAVGDVSRNLVQLFFASTALKKAYIFSDSKRSARRVSNLAVVGCGFMGSAIAGLAAARAAVDVRIKDRDVDQVVAGLSRARKIVRDDRRKGRISEFEQLRLESLLSGGLDWAGFGRADLVIEAVPEDLALKCQVFDELESHVTPECILASNTSTIPISKIAESMDAGDRLAGLHFFSPAEKMPLVEVVAHDQTAHWVVSTLVSFAQATGKTVIVVKDSPGFWVNRLLAPYLHESWTLLEEGVDADFIDSAMVEFGFPVGPITLLDEIGLDVVQRSLVALRDKFGARLAPKAGLQRLVDEGRLGRKTQSGLFRYRGGKKRRFDVGIYEIIGAAAAPPPPIDQDELVRRLVYPILSEAAWALDEGVVGSAREGDMGAIFGMGFPAFRGGPLRYVDQVGAQQVVATMEELAAKYGNRYAPSESIMQVARRNDSYYVQDQRSEH